MHIPNLDLWSIDKNKGRAILHLNLLDLLPDQRWEDAVAIHLPSQFTWVAKACDSRVDRPDLLHRFLSKLRTTSDSAWSLSVSWIYYCLTSSSCTESQLISCTASTAAHAALAGSLVPQHYTSAGVSSLCRNGGYFCIILHLSRFFHFFH